MWWVDVLNNLRRGVWLVVARDQYFPFIVLESRSHVFVGFVFCLSFTIIGRIWRPPLSFALLIHFSNHWGVKNGTWDGEIEATLSWGSSVDPQCRHICPTMHHRAISGLRNLSILTRLGMVREYNTFAQKIDSKTVPQMEELVDRPKAQSCTPPSLPLSQYTMHLNCNVAFEIVSSPK